MSKEIPELADGIEKLWDEFIEELSVRGLFETSILQWDEEAECYAGKVWFCVTPCQACIENGGEHVTKRVDSPA